MTATDTRRVRWCEADEWTTGPDEPNSAGWYGFEIDEDGEEGDSTGPFNEFGEAIAWCSQSKEFHQ